MSGNGSYRNPIDPVQSGTQTTADEEVILGPNEVRLEPIAGLLRRHHPLNSLHSWDIDLLHGPIWFDLHQQIVAHRRTRAKDLGNGPAPRPKSTQASTCSNLSRLI